MKYDPGKVWTSLLRWYEDGSADGEIPAEFKDKKDERYIIFLIENIFAGAAEYSSKKTGNKNGEK
jgi:hypothetical protein